MSHPKIGPLDPEWLLRTALVDLDSDDGCLKSSRVERLPEPRCSTDMSSQPARRDNGYRVRRDCLGQPVSPYRDWPTPFDFYRFKPE